MRKVILLFLVMVAVVAAVPTLASANTGAPCFSGCWEAQSATPDKN